MALFYNGSATIDEQMIIRKANEAFYKLIEKDMYCPMSSCIYPDDFQRFQQAFQELQNTSIPQNYISLRIMQDSGYEWCFMELSRESFTLDGRPLVHLNISTLAEDSAHRDELKKQNAEYETYLNLLGGILFSYTSRTGELSIHMHCDGQQLSLYQGDFEEWEKSLLADKIDARYLNEFKTLCEEIRAGKNTIKRNILTGIFSEDSTKELCTFRARSLSDMESFYKVFGCITVTRKQEVTAPALAGKLDAGVPVLNKKAITTYAKRAMAANNSQVHLVILDIDDFKSINDTFGHMFGDEVLLKAAEIIKESIGSAGVAGRIGGDEMLIVLTGIESHTELRNTLRSIRTGIEWAYQGVRDNLHVTCSIGVATYPEHGDNYDKIFQLADRMLYIAKSKGKNRYVIYTPELHDNKLKNKDTGKKSSADSLKNDKTGVMRRLIEDFLVRKIVPYSTALQEIGFCFELDEIIMVYGNMKLSSTWNHEGFFDDREEGAYLNPDPGFFDCFDENNILAVNGIFNLEGKSTVFPELLTSRGIESVLFYKMTHSDQAFGYIMFAKKNRRQMWAEYDKTLLASVGKILELSFRGK